MAQSADKTTYGNLLNTLLGVGTSTKLTKLLHKAVLLDAWDQFKPDLSNYVQKLTNVSFNDISVSGLFIRNAPPNVASVISRGDWLYARNPNDGGTSMIRPDQLGGLRYVATAPTHSTDPGKPGDCNLTGTNYCQYIPLANDGSGVPTGQWIKFTGVTVSFNPPSGFPAAPDLTAYFQGGQTRVEWTHSGLDGNGVAVTGFELFRSIGGNTSYVQIGGAIGAGVRFYNDANTQDAYYRIRAIGVGGASGFSNEAFVAEIRGGGDAQFYSATVEYAQNYGGDVFMQLRAVRQPDGRFIYYDDWAGSAASSPYADRYLINSKIDSDDSKNLAPLSSRGPFQRDMNLTIMKVRSKGTDFRLFPTAAMYVQPGGDANYLTKAAFALINTGNPA